MPKTLHRTALAVVLTAFAPFALGQQETPPQEDAAVETEATAPTAEEARHTASYALGFQIGNNFANQGVDIDLDAFAAGLRNAAAGEEPAYSEEQMQQAVESFQQQVAAEQQERLAVEGSANLAAGLAFLAENAEREGVTLLDSGLQIEILEPGAGDRPDGSDRVVVHYTGTLIDGTVFDSSRERDEPANFPLDGVIPGFSEGLRQIAEGGRAKLYIPPSIGYGERGVGPIPPNATLIFDVELIDVIDTAAAPMPEGDPAPVEQPEQ